jgi:hypothetical protein
MPTRIARITAAPAITQPGSHSNIDLMFEKNVWTPSFCVIVFIADLGTTLRSYQRFKA